MKIFAIGLIAFGIIVIVFPAFLALLIGGFFVFIGFNILVISGVLGGKKSGEKDDYIKVGKYKIYR